MDITYDRPILASPLRATAVVWAFLGTIAVCAMYWTIGPTRFADFSQYVQLTEQLLSDPDGWPFLSPEGISRNLLRVAGSTFGNPVGGVEALAFLTQFLVLFSVWWAARRQFVLGQNLLLCVALFAPLLALITIRATPAYLLCAAAIVHARVAQDRRLFLVSVVSVIAMLFHASSVYVLAGAFCAFVLPRRIPRVGLYWLGVTLGVLGLLVRRAVDVTVLAGMLSGLVGPAGTLLAERLSYLSGVADRVGILHIVYFAFVSLVVYRVVISQEPHPSDGLILGLFVFYGALTVSPVVAIRSSHYMVLPLLLTARVPLVDLGKGLLASGLHILGSLAVLAVSLGGLLSSLVTS